MIRAAGATSSGVAKSSSGYHFLNCSNTCGLRRTRASHAGVITVPGSEAFARAGCLRREKIVGERGGNARMLRGVPGKWDAGGEGPPYERAAAVACACTAGSGGASLSASTGTSGGTPSNCSEPLVTDENTGPATVPP